MGGITVLTFGLIFWPLTVSAIVVLPLLSRFEGRWWHSPLCFVLVMLAASVISVVANYPSWGGTGVEQECSARYCD